METVPEVHGALQRRPLVELLDRILERGVVVQADVLVSLGGVPLLGLSLRGLLAGAETLLAHGVMQDWLAPAEPNGGSSAGSGHDDDGRGKTGEGVIDGGGVDTGP